MPNIAWLDLTVPNAEELRDFYSNVAGLTAEPLDMGGYSDFVMRDRDGNSLAGVCHARGGNTGIPPVWLVYFVVDDLDASLREVSARGGAVVAGPTAMGDGARYCVVRDPAGAHCALFEKK